MNESNLPNLAPIPTANSDVERTKQVTVVGWVASLCTLFSGVTLVNEPTWPVAFGVAALATMATIICCVILRRS